MGLPASRLDHLECSACEATVEADRLHNLCACGAPYLARYRTEPALPRLRAAFSTMWRYAAMLPHRGDAVSLGEGGTPLLDAPRLAASLGVRRLSVKDESLNPTCSFKARGLSAAVTMAKSLGVTRLAIPTAGNAGGALAAYGARAGMAVEIYMPADTPEPFALEARQLGARVRRVEGLLPDCGRIVAEGAAEGRWFDVSTFKEPYRLEGKKTMGYEIFEQLHGELPSTIVYPTGGGTGLVGIWKAFAELQALGWHEGPLPRMVAVQMKGCAPIVRALEDGRERAEPWQDASTLAYGLRVPSPLADALILRTLRESHGTAVAVSESAMAEGMRALAAREGIPCGPEAGAVVAAVGELRDRGWLRDDDHALLLCTGSSHKYPDGVAASLSADATPDD